MLVVNKDVGDSVQGLRVILDWRCIAALAPEKYQEGENHLF